MKKASEERKEKKKHQTRREVDENTKVQIFTLE